MQIVVGVVKNVFRVTRLGIRGVAGRAGSVFGGDKSHDYLRIKWYKSYLFEGFLNSIFLKCLRANTGDSS